MANSEWVLAVQVQHFQNMYNAEIRNNGTVYCFCDISSSVVPCVANLTDLNLTACTSECEPYFEVRFKVCFADGTCSNMENATAVIDNILDTCISPLLVQLRSNEFIIADVINVWLKSTSLHHTLCLYYYYNKGIIML